VAEYRDEDPWRSRSLASLPTYLPFASLPVDQQRAFFERVDATGLNDMSLGDATLYDDTVRTRRDIFRAEGARYDIDGEPLYEGDTRREIGDPLGI